MLIHRCRQGVICLVVAITALTVPACSDDPAGPVDRAPEFPSMSTMTMDLSYFDQGGASPAAPRTGDLQPSLSAATQNNWNNAAVRAIFVQLSVYAAFHTPVGAFAAAIHSIPQRQSDSSWLWTYIFVDNDIDYSIFLYGKDIGERISWRMEVSSTDPSFMLDHFVWFEGESFEDDSSGFWRFYMPNLPAGGSAAPSAVSAAETTGFPVLLIEWWNAGDVHALLITNIEVGGEDEGDEVEFYADHIESYLEYRDASSGDIHNITWYPDGSGVITVPDYNNGEPGCWDVDRNDTVCF